MTKIGSGNLHSVPSSLPVQPGSCTWPFLLDRKLPVYTSACTVRSPPPRFCRSLGNHNSLSGTALGYLTRMTVILLRCGFLNHLGCPARYQLQFLPAYLQTHSRSQTTALRSIWPFFLKNCAALLNCWTPRFSSVVGRETWPA